MAIQQFVMSPVGTHPVSELCGWAGKPVELGGRPDLVAEAFDLWTVNNHLSAIKGLPFKAGARSMLWEVGRKVLGTDPPNYPQEIGDCVSFGSKNACEHLQFYPIANGVRNKWTRVFPPYLYGCGRIFIGKGEMGNQDGSVGAWQAQAVLQYGTIPIDAPNCPTYSGAIARKWGYKPGPPDEFITVGKQHLVKSAAAVTSWEDVVAALTNGYPVTIASNVGFDMTPRADGFHHYSTHWGHQMCCVPQTVVSYGVTSNFIEDVREGDFVVTHHGRMQRVSHTFKRWYEGGLIVIKTRGHLPLKVTPNHPILVLRDSDTDFDFDADANSNSRVLVAVSKKVKIWVNAEDVVKTDVLISPIVKFTAENITIPQWHSRPISKLKQIEPSRDFAWFCGLYAADGDSEPGRRITIKLSKGQDDEANRCVHVASQLGLEARVKHIKNYIRIRIHSAVLADSFLDWFGKQTDKHLPEWLFSGWPLDAVIEGIFAGDGNYPYLRTNGRRIVNTSRVLIEQCRAILLHLGFLPSLGRFVYKSPNEHWNPRFYVEWYENTKKTQYNRICDNELHVKIADLTEENYAGYVYNFEVDGDHSYVADGLSVHNCIIGVDDDPSEPYGCILNSWGDVHGQVKDFKTGDIWPKGTLRVRKKDIISILEEKDSFAYSATDLFVAQSLPDDAFNLW